MKTTLFILSAIILIIPLFWSIKHEGKFKLTNAGIAFIILVLVSIAINALVDIGDNEKDRNNEKHIITLLDKIDSLKYVTTIQYDSIIVMQGKLQNTIIHNDSVKKAIGLYDRPLVKMIDANLLSDGKIELKFVNDSKRAASRLQGRYSFIMKSLVDNTDKEIVQKPMPFIPTDILTDKDDYISIKVPIGIIDVRNYIDSNWIYLVISLSYSDILAKKNYLYETASRLRKLDNGKFSGSYEYEFNHYIKFIRK